MESKKGSVSRMQRSFFLFFSFLFFSFSLTLTETLFNTRMTNRKDLDITIVYNLDRVENIGSVFSAKMNDPKKNNRPFHSFRLSAGKKLLLFSSLLFSSRVSKSILFFSLSSKNRSL